MNFTGRLISQQSLGNKYSTGNKLFNFRPKTGLNNWGQLEGILAANKDSIKDIFLIYSPIITTKAN